jgi:hypothetical protein
MSRVRNRMIQDMQLAGLVDGTQDLYLRAVGQRAAYDRVAPDQLSERHVEKYLVDIRDELGDARPTILLIPGARSTHTQGHPPQIAT